MNAIAAAVAASERGVEFEPLSDARVPDAPLGLVRAVVAELVEKKLFAGPDQPSHVVSVFALVAPRCSRSILILSTTRLQASTHMCSGDTVTSHKETI